MSVCAPLAIAGQPCSCGALGAPNDSRNHSRTSGWNGLRAGDSRGRFGIHRKLPSRFRVRQQKARGEMIAVGGKPMTLCPWSGDPYIATGCESVMWSDAPAGRHASYFLLALAATAPAPAPAAAPITVPLVL